jgi:intracellular sulfur oxidation DsrE/DsrF family protein
MCSLVFLIKEITLVDMIKKMYLMINQTTHMVDDDDKEIKVILNMLSIKVFPGRRKGCRSRLGRD